jgi:hypothetical protein
MYYPSGTGMAYPDAPYGNELITPLILTNDYETTFGKSAVEVYSDWARYMEAVMA